MGIETLMTIILVLLGLSFIAGILFGMLIGSLGRTRELTTYVDKLSRLKTALTEIRDAGQDFLVFGEPHVVMQCIARDALKDVEDTKCK